MSITQARSSKYKSLTTTGTICELKEIHRPRNCRLKAQKVFQMNLMHTQIPEALAKKLGS